MAARDMSSATTGERLDGSRTVEILSALAHASRLEAYRLLVRYLPHGLSAGDIARLLAVQHNTLSTHLSILEKADLVVSRREGRSIIYAANIGTAQAVTAFMLKDCCAVTDVPEALEGLPKGRPFPAKRVTDETDRALNVLVVCPGNSARSIMAEALLNREGAGVIRAFSAGSNPALRPAEQTVSLLSDLGYETEALRSKSWLEFAGPGAPRMDFVLMVCEAAKAKHPAWPGKPLVVNWEMPDPVLVQGADAERRRAFLDTYRGLADKVAALVNLDLKAMSRPVLESTLAEIGRTEG